MSKQPEFFTTEELRQPDLSVEEKYELIYKLINQAKIGARYLYKVYDVASMLRLTIDELQGLIYYYRLDCISIRNTLRVPWWSIVEYLADPADDVDKAFQEYLKTLPKQEKKE